MIPVSVVIMTRNEASNIGPCLEALGRFDQIFVVDSGQCDGTAEIAAGLGLRSCSSSGTAAYPKKKQWCLENLPFRHTWVLYCDADERITPELADEIALLMSSRPGMAGYFIHGQPVFGGKRHRHGAWNRKLALLDRRQRILSGFSGSGHRHDVGSRGALSAGTSGAGRATANPMIHEEATSLHAWFDRHNRYSDWEAALLADTASQVSEPSREGLSASS